MVWFEEPEKTTVMVVIRSWNTKDGGGTDVRHWKKVTKIGVWIPYSHSSLDVGGTSSKEKMRTRCRLEWKC